MQSHTENNHSIANPKSNTTQKSQLNVGMKAKSIEQNYDQTLQQRLHTQSKQNSDTKVIVNRDHSQNQYTSNSRNQYKSSTFNSKRYQREGNHSMDQRIEKTWMNSGTSKYQRSYQIQNNIQNTKSGRYCNDLNQQNINSSSGVSRTYQSQNIQYRQGTQSQERQNFRMTGYDSNLKTQNLKVDHFKPQKHGNQQEIANNLKQNINFSPNRVEYSSSVHSRQNITKTYSTRNINDKHYQYSLNNRETTRAMRISRSRMNQGLSLSPGPSSSIHASNVNGASYNRHSYTIASMKIDQRRVISKDEWYLSSGKQQSFWLHQQSSQFNNNNSDNERNLQTATECVDRLYKDNYRRLQEREQLLIQRRAKEESEQEVYSFHPEIYSRKSRGGSVSARNFSQFYQDQVKFQERIFRKREHLISKESDEYYKGQRLQLTRGTQRIITRHTAHKSVDNRSSDFEVHTRLYKNQALIQGENKKLCNCYKHKTAHTHEQCKTELSLEAQKRILKEQVSSVQRLYVGYRNKHNGGNENDNDRQKTSQENERYYYSRKTFYKLYKDFVRYFKRDIYFYMFIENEEIYRQVIYKKAMKNQTFENKDTTKRTQYDNILIKYSSYLKLMKTIGFMNIQGKQEKEKQIIEQIWQQLNYKKEEAIRVENLFIYLCGIMNVDLDILYKKQNHQGHRKIGEWICYCENLYAHYQSYDDMYKLHRKYYSLYLNRKNYRNGHKEDSERNFTFAPKIGWRSKVIAKVVTIEASQLNHTHDCKDPKSRDKGHNQRCRCLHRNNKDEQSIERNRKTNEIISGRRSKFMESEKKQQKRESFSQGYIGQLSIDQKNQETNIVKQGTGQYTISHNITEEERRVSKKLDQEFHDEINNRDKQISFGGRQQPSQNLQQQKSKKGSQQKQFSFAQQNDKGQSKKMSKSQEGSNQVFYQGLQITDADEELEIIDNQPHQVESQNSGHETYQVEGQNMKSKVQYYQETLENEGEQEEEEEEEEEEAEQKYEKYQENQYEQDEEEQLQQEEGQDGENIDQQLNQATKKNSYGNEKLHKEVLKQNSFGDEKQNLQIYEQSNDENNQYEAIEYSRTQLTYKQKSEQIGDDEFSMNDRTTVHDNEQDKYQKFTTKDSQISPDKSNLQGYSDNQISTGNFNEHITEQKASDSDNSSKSNSNNSNQDQNNEKKESLTNFTQQIKTQQDQYDVNRQSNESNEQQNENDDIKYNQKEEAKEESNSQQTGQNLFGMMSLSLTGGIMRKKANQASQKTVASSKTIQRTESNGDREASQNNQGVVSESLHQNVGEKQETEIDNNDNKSQYDADGQKVGGGLNISISLSVTRGIKRGIKSSKQNQSSVSVHSAVQGGELNSQRSVSQFDSQQEDTSQYQGKSDIEDLSQIDNQEQDDEGEGEGEGEGEEQEVEVEEEYEEIDENGRKVIRKRWVRRIIKTTTKTQGGKYTYKKRNYTGKSGYKYGVSTQRRDSSGSLKKYNQTEHQRQQYITSTFGASYKQKTTGSSGSVTEHQINKANGGSSTQYQSNLYKTNQYQSSSNYKQSSFKTTNLNSKSSSAVANFMTQYLKTEKERKTPRKSNHSSQKSLHQYVEQQDNHSSNGSVHSQDSQQRAMKLQGSSALTSTIAKSLFSKSKITTSTYQTSSQYKSSSKYGMGQTKSTTKKTTTATGKVVTGVKKEGKSENADSYEEEPTQQQEQQESLQIVDNQNKQVTEVKSVQKQTNKLSTLMGKSLYGQTSTTYKTTSNYNQKSITNNKKKL